MKLNPTPSGASLNSETGELILRFTNTAEDDNLDPVAFVPDTQVIVVITGAVVTTL